MCSLVAYSLLSRVSHSSPFPKLLGPGLVGLWLDFLPTTQATHGDLAAEAFQHYTNLLFQGVLAPSSGLNRADEGPGRLCAFIGGRCFTCLCLGHLWLLHLR